MEDWVKKIIVEKAAALGSREKRNFLIAYKELPEALHGYLHHIAKSQNIWPKNVDEKDLVTLKKAKSLPIWQYSDDKVKKNSKLKGVYCTVETPYLTLDGMIAAVNLEHSGGEVSMANPSGRYKVDIVLEATEKAVKATVTSELRGISTAYAVIGSDGLEMAASSAIRKAYNYMGYGRFPTFSTPYGPLVHPMVKTGCIRKLKNEA